MEPIKPSLSTQSIAGAKAVAPKPKEEKIPEPKEVYTTRSQRISKALDEFTVKQVLSAVRTGTATYSGMVVGTAIASVLTLNPIASMAGGVAGAILGIVLDKIHAGEKLKAAAHLVKEEVKEHLKDAGSHIKKAFLGAIDHKAKELKAHKTSTLQKFKAAKTSQEVKGEEKPSLLKSLWGGFTGLIKGYKATPNFIYPSIQKATAMEREVIIKTLDALPLKEVTSTPTITMTDLSSLGASGLTRRLPFGSPIDLDPSQIAIKGFDQHVIVHELAHSMDFQKGAPLIGYSNKAPWGKEPFLFDPWVDTPGSPPYSSTNRLEDFAQSHAYYHLNPDELKKANPAKFDAMQKLHEPTLYDKVMDKKPIRDAGKKIGEVMEKVPHLRTALETAAAISGPLTMHKGAEDWEKGITEGDKKKKFDGKMELAQGITGSFKFTAPISLGLAATHWILNRKIKNHKLTLEKAHEISNKVLAASAGPVGMATYATLKEMFTTTKAEEKETKALGDKLTHDDKLYVAKVAGAGAAGGVAGTVLGFSGGAIAGAAIGGVLGGPLGAVVGGLLGKAAGSMAGAYYGAKLSSHAVK
jgi:hypothetical protein